MRDWEFDELSEEDKQFLTIKGIQNYMSIVGALIWIQGVRLDILFSVMYLSWYTKQPRMHHWKMSQYVLGYLDKHYDMPLVLGGDENFRLTLFVDSSLGTGKNSRTVTGIAAKANSSAGAIFGKSYAQTTVKDNTFHAELVGTTDAMKVAARLENTFNDMRITTTDKPIIYNDNEATIAFVKGDHVAKGCRHMELREWLTREQYQMGKVDISHMAGNILVADHLTKLGTVTEHRPFATDIQGLTLLDCDYFAERDNIWQELYNQKNKV